jgi:hypothetical protein
VAILQNRLVLLKKRNDELRAAVCSTFSIQRVRAIKGKHAVTFAVSMTGKHVRGKSEVHTLTKASRKKLYLLRPDLDLNSQGSTRSDEDVVCAAAAMSDLWVLKGLGSQGVALHGQCKLSWGSAWTTAVATAILKGRVQNVEYLISQGADLLAPCMCSNNAVFTPAQCAAQYEQQGVLELLQSIGIETAEAEKEAEQIRQAEADQEETCDDPFGYGDFSGGMDEEDEELLYAEED